MAVAHSAASESHTGATGSASQASFSWTHTQTGTPQGVLVFVSTYNSTTDLITSVTYGGVALTRLSGGLAIDTATEPGRLDTFFLGSGLGTGNQTITVNRTNNATVMYAAAATVTAAANTAVPTQTIVLLQDDGTLTVQSVDDTSPGVNSLRYAGAYSGLNTPPTAGTGSTLLNSIDIGNYGSALAVETTAGQGARNVGFSGTTDDRAAVHLAIRELVPRTLTQTVGAFTLTGQPNTLSRGRVMAGGTGSFTLTGNPAATLQNPKIDGNVGTFSLAGQPNTLGHNPKIDAGVGAFTFTGQPATFTKTTPKALAAGVGTFTLASNGATFRRTWAIQGGVGTFTLTGNPAGLTKLRVYKIDATVGTFTLTGQPATLAQSQTMPITVGTFTLGGQPASLRQNPAITGERGQFTLNGQPATLKQGYLLTGVAGAFTFTGNPATLAKQSTKQLTAAVGVFSLTGQPATLSRIQPFVAECGAFTLTGNPVSLRLTRVFSTTTGTHLLTGAPTTFTYAQRRRVVLIF